MVRGKEKLEMAAARDAFFRLVKPFWDWHDEISLKIEQKVAPIWL